MKHIIPPTKTAVKQNPSTLQLALAKSLACYTTGDDGDLDRCSFLEMVRDHIEMDLETGEY